MDIFTLCVMEYMANRSLYIVKYKCYNCKDANNFHFKYNDTNIMKRTFPRLKVKKLFNHILWNIFPNTYITRQSNNGFYSRYTKCERDKQ